MGDKSAAEVADMVEKEVAVLELLALSDATKASKEVALAMIPEPGEGITDDSKYSTEDL